MSDLLATGPDADRKPRRPAKRRNRRPDLRTGDRRRKVGAQKNARRANKRAAKRRAGGKSRAAAARYAPQTYARAPRILTGFDRHLASRFSYGLTPDLAQQVHRVGGARAWFNNQLSPETIPDWYADQVRSWWPSLAYDATTLWQRNVDKVEGSWVVMTHYQRSLLVRRIMTNRQVHEIMTEFWESHFHVPVGADGVFAFRVNYGDTIRAHALGRFPDLLAAVTTHPAMGMFLDNAQSTKKAPNENLGRELLELHTVGRGHYTEDDVKSSARILTGWRVNSYKTWEVYYSPKDHWTGPVQVMGFTDANTDPDGRGTTARYLSYLATHPATVERLCRKLAVKFVSDNPPAGLVSKLATAWTTSGGDIRHVLRTLVGSPEFAAADTHPAHLKVRDPAEDVIATYRALGATPRRPAGDNDAANAIIWQASSLGASPHAWPRPDGPPQTNDAWSTPNRVLGSYRMHYAMAGTWWPSEGVTYRELAQWLPTKKVTFAQLVDYLCRSILGRPSDRRLLEVACLAVDAKPHVVITRSDQIVRWKMPILLTALLDTPEHLTR